MKSLLGTLTGAIRNQNSPVRFSPRSTVNPQTFDRNDMIGQMHAMGSVGTLFSVVNRTSTAVSQVDWNLYRKSPDGDPEKRQLVMDHAALRVWNKPNAFYNRNNLTESLQQHIDLTGEFCIVVAKDPRVNFPTEIWPVRPDRIVPIPHPEKFLTGYWYLTPDGDKQPLQLDEVIHVKMPNPLDLYRGLGPVQAVMTDVDSNRYSAEWNRQFFINSALPGGIIHYDRNLTDDQFDEARERWNEQHRGVASAHRVAILENATFESRNYSMKDMQFTELRALSRDTILEAFGMPKNVLGIVEDVNRSSADSGEQTFARWLVIPRLERFKLMLNSQFLPMFKADPRLEFDYCDAVPADREADDRERTSKANAFKALSDAGVDHDTAAAVVGLTLTGRM